MEQSKSVYNIQPLFPQTPSMKVSFDGIGALIFSALTGVVIYGVSKVGAWGWNSAEMWIMASSAGLLLLLYLYHSSRHRSPFLPVRMFQHPSVSTGLLVSFVSFMLVNTIQVVMPFHITGHNGVNIMVAGVIMMAYPSAVALCGPIAGYLYDQYAVRTLPLWGLLLIGVSSLTFALWLGHMSLLAISLVLVLSGIGMGFTASPNNSYIMSSIPSGDAGAAGGLIALTRNAGMVFGAALGLGAVSVSDTFQTSAETNDFFGIFALNFLICLVTMFIFVYKNKWRYSINARNEKVKESI
jgi:MFS family permease